MTPTLDSPEIRWQLDLERRAEEAERQRRRKIVASVVGAPKPIPQQQLFGLAVFCALVGALAAVCLVLSFFPTVTN